MKPSISPVNTIAHDLNNQLTVILNSLDALQAKNPHEPDVLLALRAAERSIALTAKLVPASRTALAPTPDDPVRISIREIVSAAAARVRERLPVPMRLQVECRSHASLPAAHRQLEEAIFDLCMNAAQSMDGLGAIQLTASDEPGGLLLSVHDTEQRAGVTPSDLSRVERIAAECGGSVSIHHTLPHGTWFRIHLPEVALPDAFGRLKVADSGD